MPQIKKLSQKVINQIAAGEVVERPASIVKELLENSIDAGATSITINIDGGGTKLIWLQDDGHGMSKKDLTLAVQPHTTSKLTSLEDLDSIDTLGFRGEALASIGSVSKLTIKSKQKSEQGYEISLADGLVKEKNETVISEGTVVEVKDLFYNVPARKKFLKSEQTELRHVIDVVINVVMVNPKIAFKLSHNGRVIYHFPAEKTSKDSFISEQRVRKIMSVDENSKLIPIFSDGNGIVITGFVGMPNLAVNKRRDQYIFVNRRAVSDRVVNRSIKEGFGTFIPNDKYPVYVVSVEMQGDLVDVNVHPRKSEVKFKDTNMVFSAIKKAVRVALQKEFDFKQSAEPIIGEVNTYDEKNSVAVKRLRPSDNMLQESRKGTEKAWDKKFDQVKKTDLKIKDSLEFTKTLLGGDNDSHELFDGGGKAHQLHNKYLVVEAPGEIQIWDQHAAAERIRYEKMLGEYKGKGVETQKLLTPVVVSVSSKLLSLIEESSSELVSLGFSVEIFGSKEVRLNSVPAILSGGDSEQLFKDLLVELEENIETGSKKNTIERKSEYFIKTLACHSSVTANMRLQPEAVDQFVKDLKSCQNPYSCPHGRPIVWRIKTAEIDKRFER